MATRKDGPPRSNIAPVAQEQGEGENARRFGFRHGASTTPAYSSLGALDTFRFILAPLIMPPRLFNCRRLVTSARSGVGHLTVVRLSVWRVDAPLSAAWSARKMVEGEATLSGSGSQETVAVDLPREITLDPTVAWYLAGISHGSAANIDSLEVVSGTAPDGGFEYTAGGVNLPAQFTVSDVTRTDTLCGVWAMSRVGRLLLSPEPKP